MIGTIVGLILLVVVLGVVFWAGQRLMALVPLEEPFRTIVYVLGVLLTVVLVIYVFIVLLNVAGIHVPMFGALTR
jgi:hypothetical protein